MVSNTVILATAACLVAGPLGVSGMWEQHGCDYTIPVVKYRADDADEGQGGKTIMEVVAGRQPVIFDNAPSTGWASKGKWDAAYLKENFGDLKVKYRSSERNVFTIRSHSTDMHIKTTVDERDDVS